MQISDKRAGTFFYLRLLLAMALLVATWGVAPVAAAGHDEGRLTNLDHIDYLTERVAPGDQEGHTTYQLDTMPEIGVLWTYAEPRDEGPYARIGGGQYHPETDTYGQGAFNADDISRAAIVYLRHWQQFGDDHSRDQAMQLLRGLTYMQTIDGANSGNVVLWMQPDGTLNPSADPVELPDPSDSDVSYWLARTIWALGEGVAAFADEDPAFTNFLRDRMELAIDAVNRQLLEPEYGETDIVDGVEWPAWLIADGADASSEAIYGLVAYVETTGDGAAEKMLNQLAEGIAMMQQGDVREWPFQALMPWAGSRSVWHAWGNEMAGSLAAAGRLTGEGTYTEAAVRAVSSFTPHMLIQNGPDQAWLPAPADVSQIAYGADATLRNLLQTYETTGNQAFLDVAGIAAAWFFGNNPAGAQMYDPSTGRTFDGVNSDASVNRNSGAESTIHGLLAMLALDARPELAERAMIAQRVDQVTWQLIEAENGRIEGGSVVEPESTWTGESLYTGSGYVELRPGGSIVMDVDLPTRDSYHVMPVIWRQQSSDAVTMQRLSRRPAGTQTYGGAGEQGPTPVPGYADIGTGQTRGPVRAGPSQLEIMHSSGSDAADIDAVLVQPDLEWLILEGDHGQSQALLRSFDSHRSVKRLSLASAEMITARSYDAHGELVSTRTGRNGQVVVIVEPGGFSVVKGTAGTLTP